ncbi:MAG TPA: glycosyltransferase family 2 protein [Candidatus Nitrosocosmicus sp.]|nr:glycosyltransferase family 2 protein [Candidatus Nitrosocosmicus sp.]
MDLSIIIISYNTKDITKKCLDTIYNSLRKTRMKVEILVIDNASEDGSVEMLRQYEKITNPDNIKFAVIISKENLGYVKGNNLGVTKAKAKTILFLNSDIEVLDDAISILYSYFVKQTKYHFLGGKLFNKDMSTQASCGHSYNLFNIFIFLFLRGDYYGITRFSPNEIKDVAWVSGACFITKKEYFEYLKGFDEGIFMYMDEIDLFYRATKVGYKIGFYPECKFIHLGSASSAGRTQPILQVYKGYLYFYKKHFSYFSLLLLKCMLQLKAIISLAIGLVFRLVGKEKKANYLINTYAEAYTIAKNYR